AVDVKNPDFNPSLHHDFPNNPAFFNRLTTPEILLHARNLDQVFEPTVKGKAEVRLHVDVSTDNFPGLVEQAIGIAPGSIGLPQVDYDFKVDVDWDLKE